MGEKRGERTHHAIMRVDCRTKALAFEDGVRNDNGTGLARLHSSPLGATFFPTAEGVEFIGVSSVKMVSNTGDEEDAQHAAGGVQHAVLGRGLLGQEGIVLGRHVRHF